MLPRYVICLIVCGLFVSEGLAQSPSETKPPDPISQFFDSGAIPDLRFKVSKEAEQSLLKDPRKNVTVTLQEYGKENYEGVQIKIKGGAGSFKPFDSRPSLTVKLKKKGTRFHGLDRFYLNNSAQDPWLLSELVCSQLYREAGYPCPRVTHARVWLNDRDLGLYVLKEGFDEKWLQRTFGSSKGDFYDPPGVMDINDKKLPKDSGGEPNDHTNLLSLLAACQEPNEQKRYQLIEQRLDVDKFLTFVAIELLTCHWDGYSRTANNYRLYFNPENGNKAIFLPTGMDQMFGPHNAAVLYVPPSIVAKAVLSNPAWLTKYTERVKSLLPMFSRQRTVERMEQIQKQKLPLIAAFNQPEWVKKFESAVSGRRSGLFERYVFLRKHLGEAAPKTVVFQPDGTAKIGDWRFKFTGDARLDEPEANGKLYLTISTGKVNDCTAYFHRPLELPAGKYRLEALAQVRDVTPMNDKLPKGLGIRLMDGTRKDGLVGTTSGTSPGAQTGGWEKISFSFEVPAGKKEVELVIELRCSARTPGIARIESDSIRLVKE